jgi:two-component system cell cycle response regulator CpdR
LESSILILVVDDEAIICVGIEDALQEGGFAVHLAHSGTEAIEFLDSCNGLVVGLVTDIRLGPGPDGWDVARHAREIQPAIPVVYMSGDSAIDHASRGVPDSLMVQKPFAVMQIVTAISSLLNAVPPHSSAMTS